MLTDKQLAARRDLQRWLPWMGLILLAFGLYISAFLLPDLVETAAGPQQLTLDEAANVASATRTYARIEGGAWDCATLQQVQGLSATSIRYGFGPLNEREETKYTEVFFTDNARDVVVFVTLSGDVQCDDLTRQWPTGYLYRMSDGTRQALTNEARLARYFTTDTFLEFCGYCGRENSLIGAGFGLVFTVAGMAMLFFWWRGRQRG